MNNLAKKTTMTADDVLALFEQGCKRGKELLPGTDDRAIACHALDATREALAFCAAYEEGQKKGQ